MPSPLVALTAKDEWARSQINREFLSGLELMQHKIFPLPGAQLPRRLVEDDDRIGPKPMIIGGASVGPKDSDIITFHEHLATVKHPPSRQMFVAFRQTLDFLLRQQKDPVRFPRHLMLHPFKRTELKIYIYRVVKDPRSPEFSVLRTSEQWWHKWLATVPEDAHHNTVAHFLMQRDIIRREDVKELFR